ncbi:hypothetical protein, conserved [Plasmodium gonderi]|uniref:Uncharacterized protein n=1 Tax=Plasmodium gonderi TaxID=77519 RepID=A0A1Y1JIB0_PLAGO|nr:hypothetical protein, conserved [Plasmodium gonderi]GAW81368.1 hypothetical protein, conserved [Plasmodium gonderi]
MDSVNSHDKEDNINLPEGNESNISSKEPKSDTSKKSSKSTMSKKLRQTDKLEPSNDNDNLIKSDGLNMKETNSGVFHMNDDKINKYRDFLQNSSDEYTIQQMETFLKHGISNNGVRMMTRDTCSWVYDYYKTTKTSTPALKEFTPGTTVDYYYYTTPFRTQIGNINLVMMHSQVNFGDGTSTPADRAFKINAVTPEMVKAAKIKARAYKNDCADWI